MYINHAKILFSQCFVANADVTAKLPKSNPLTTTTLYHLPHSLISAPFHSSFLNYEFPSVYRYGPAPTSTEHSGTAEQLNLYFYLQG